MNFSFGLNYSVFIPPLVDLLTSRLGKFTFFLIIIYAVTRPWYANPFGLQPYTGVPSLVAHRGDQFLFPEHTFPAYESAILQGIDFVETDLLLTSDGHFVCYHSPSLRNGTDVRRRPDFGSKMTKSVNFIFDEKNVTVSNDWMVSDLTLKEVQSLRLQQKKIGLRTQIFNGAFGISSFQELIDAVHRDTWKRMQINTWNGRPIGIISELKVPAFYNQRNLKKKNYMETKFLSVLKANGYPNDKCKYNNTWIPCSPMIIQCHDIPTILWLRANTKLTVMTLLDYQSNSTYLTYKGLKVLEGKSHFLGVWKEFMYHGVEPELIYHNKTYNKKEINSLGGFIGPKDWVPYANSLGMRVAVFTIYHSAEASKRGCAFKCVGHSKEEEMNYFFKMGVEMMFVEGLGESILIRDKIYRKI